MKDVEAGITFSNMKDNLLEHIHSSPLPCPKTYLPGFFMYAVITPEGINMIPVNSIFIRNYFNHSSSHQSFPSPSATPFLVNQETNTESFSPFSNQQFIETDSSLQPLFETHPPDSTLDPADSTLDPADSTLDPADSTLDPDDSILDPSELEEPDNPLIPRIKPKRKAPYREAVFKYQPRREPLTVDDVLPEIINNALTNTPPKLHFNHARTVHLLKENKLWYFLAHPLMHGHISTLAKILQQLKMQ